MRIRNRSAVLTCSALLLLAACGSHPDAAAPAPSPSVQVAKGPALLPVPRGDGSRVPDDFNGDGHRDLVLDDLVKAQAHADDPGIGIVYGGPNGLVPGARQLIDPERQAATVDGRLPALFDAEASCDLDGDGFTDLLVSTDPPYDGQGQPPVPLQVLFGSPKGLAGKAVTLVVPARARVGDDWPDQPVCGDFDGDGSADLVLHASGGRLSFLRGPFSRKGAPKAAALSADAPGNVPTGPAADVDHDGYDDLLVRGTEGTGTCAVVLGGPDGPARTGVVLPAGIDVALGAFGKGDALDAAVGAMGETSLRYDLPTAGRHPRLPRLDAGRRRLRRRRTERTRLQRLPAQALPRPYEGTARGGRGDRRAARDRHHPRALGGRSRRRRAGRPDGADVPERDARHGRRVSRAEEGPGRARTGDHLHHRRLPEPLTHRRLTGSSARAQRRLKSFPNSRTTLAHPGGSCDRRPRAEPRANARRTRPAAPHRLRNAPP